MSDLLHIPDSGATFLSGPAGTGKTTAAVARLEELLRSGVPGRSILVTAPQRSLLRPYRARLRRADLPAGEAVETLTLGGLARHAADLAWPAVAGAAGFARPDLPPIFLALETAQYYMMGIVRPLIERQGYFEGVSIPLHRICGQLLDSLGKSALMGFPHEEIGPRLSASWDGEQARKVVFHQAQECVSLFRRFCLDHNLLDFSLRVELLFKHLLQIEWCRTLLFGRYRHLIADNVEEETPAVHDLMKVWLPTCASALLVCDADAGYRTFLGADPEGARALRDACQHRLEATESRVMSPGVRALERRVARALSAPDARAGGEEEAPLALEVEAARFFPQMLDRAVGRVAGLIHEEGMARSEVVVLAPYLGDTLRFALMERLTRAGVETRSLRPSRSLAEEPTVRGLMTWAALAHPAWGRVPPGPDVAHALAAAVDGLDPARAHLLTHWVYLPGFGGMDLRPFGDAPPEVQGRIGREAGRKYERLRAWLEAYRNGTPLFLDHFLSRLFGEVLSQPGYGFHAETRQGRFDRGRIAGHLIASAARFRKTVASADLPGDLPPDDSPDRLPFPLDRAFVEMVEAGLIAGQYVEPHAGAPPDAVLLAPATTFLLENRPVDVQVWLNAGSFGWWERPYQPLTHPYVLTRRWERDRLWTDAEEQASRRNEILRLLRGLLRRCRRRVVLAFSALDERGFEERGPLLNIVQQALRSET
jgi:hypothetical protein